MKISEALKVFNELNDFDLSSDEDKCGKEIDIVILPPKMDVLTDDEAVNNDDLLIDPSIPRDVSGELYRSKL